MRSESILLSEIKAQPEALERMLSRQAEAASSAGTLLRQEDVEYVVIAARGSSLNAARYAQYVVGRAHRVPVALATPSLYTIYRQPPRLRGALVIGISQSGRSPDVVAVLEEGRRQGRPTVALTNAPDSPLAQVADVVLCLEAGEERAVAATKTYANSIGAIALLYTALAADAPALAELRAMPELVARQIELTLRTEPSVPLGAGGVVTVLGRGVNYSTAYEIALKIRELAGLFVEAYSPADIRHGPIAALTDRAAAIVVAPDGPARQSVVEIVPELRRRGVATTVIGGPCAGVDAWFRLVDGVPEWLSPLMTVIPGQLAALQLAERLGKNVDSPEGLTKVTLTL